MNNPLNTTWVNANVDFGIPGVILVVNFRSPEGMEFHNLLTSLPDPKDIPVMERMVKEFICKYRGKLDPYRMILYAMEGNLRYGAQWKFFVFHPALTAKQYAYEVAPEELLKVCPVCKKGIAPDKTHMKSEPDGSGFRVLIVHPECAAAEWAV